MRHAYWVLVCALIMGMSGCIFPFPSGSPDGGITTPPPADAGMCGMANEGRTTTCVAACNTEGVSVCLRDPSTGSFGWSRCLPTDVRAASACMPMEVPAGSPCNAAVDGPRTCAASTATCVVAQICLPGMNVWSSCQPISLGCGDAGTMPVADASSDAMTPADAMADVGADVAMMDSAPAMDVVVPADAAMPMDAGADAMMAADVVVPPDVVIPTTDAARSGCPCVLPTQPLLCLDRCNNVGLMTCADYCAGSTLCFAVLACMAPIGDAGVVDAMTTADGMMAADAASDVQADAPDVREAGTDAAADAPPDVQPDAVADAQADVMADSMPDVAADVREAGADAMADVAADAGMDAVADVMSDTAPDVADVREAGVDATADAMADASPDVTADVVDAMASMDASADVVSDAMADAAVVDVPVSGSFCDGAVGCNDLRIVPNVALFGSCPSGWTLRTWEPVAGGGAIERNAPPGGALNLAVQPWWTGWLIVDAFCGAGKRDWSPFLHRSATTAGISSVTMGMEDITMQTGVCRDIYSDPTRMNPQFIRLGVPIERWYRGQCPDGTRITP